ncbi:MAG TPA: DUF4412 domain-containing protein [Bacteroidia bacterium]|nr:DUF4412 domain-containing protein [Bacteroidia bacterium]
MKKTVTFLSLTAIVASSILYSSCKNGASSSSTSSSNFEGVLTYEVNAGAGLPPEVGNMLKSMVMSTYIKGDLSRTEESMAGNSNIVIADNKKPNDPIMLISMFGHKYAVRRNDSMKKAEEANIPKIEYIDSTKQIAGYSCKKAKITLNLPKQGTSVSDVYYTTDIPYADPQGQFKGLKGMPMEFSVSMSGLNLTFSVKTVEKKALADSLFTIPADYKQVSLDELQKQLSSSMASDTNTSGTK